MTTNTAPEPQRGWDVPKLAMGVLLVTFGLAVLADRFYWVDWLDWREIFRLWPLWLVAFGVIKVLWPEPRRSRLAGFWPILIGGVFLADILDWLPLTESWPIFIVGAGLLIVLRSMGYGESAGKVRT